MRKRGGRERRDEEEGENRKAIATAIESHVLHTRACVRARVCVCVWVTRAHEQVATVSIPRIENHMYRSFVSPSPSNYLTPSFVPTKCAAASTSRLRNLNALDHSYLDYFDAERKTRETVRDMAAAEKTKIEFEEVTIVRGSSGIQSFGLIAPVS